MIAYLALVIYGMNSLIGNVKAVQTVCTKYDGYFDATRSHMQFSKGNASAFKFNVFHQTPNSYMDTFSFEAWINLQAYDTNIYPVDQHYIYEIQNIGTATFSSTNVTITVANVSTSAVFSNFGMTSDNFYNQWHHFAIAYRAYKKGYGIYLWIHIDGLRRASLKISAPLSYTQSTLGVWIVGNSLVGYQLNKGGQVLNANMRYLTIWTQAWDETIDFSSVVHNEPTPYWKSGLQLYQRFDQFTTVDFYLMTTRNDQLEFKNLQIGSSTSKEFICKCQGELNNFISLTGTPAPFSSLNVNNNQISNGFTIDIWLKRYDTAIVNNNIFVLSGVLSLDQVNSQVIAFTPGGSGGPQQQMSSALYKNMWGHYAIKVLSSNAIAYFWGQLAQTFSYSSVGFSTSTTLTISNTFNGAIYSIRLWSQTGFSDAFFATLYSQTVHPKLSYDFLNGLVFEVILTKYQLKQNNSMQMRAFPLSKSFTNTSIELSDRLNSTNQTEFLNLQSTFAQDIFLNVNAMRSNLAQVTDNGPCPGYLWDGAACADDRSSVFFPNEIVNNQALTQMLKGRNRYMTYEMWFKPFKPINHTASTIIAHTVFSQSNLDFEITINYNNQSSLHTIICDLKLNVEPSDVEITGVQEGVWQHYACITSSVSKNLQGLLWNHQTQQEIFQSTENTYTTTFLLGYYPTYIANSPTQDKPFLGHLREMRIWFETKTLSYIRLARYQNIASDSMTNLINYFRLRQPPQLNQLENIIPTGADQQVLNVSVNSYYPQSNGLFRWQMDTDIVICTENSHYVNGCCKKIGPSMNLTLFEYQQLAIFDTQIQFDTGESDKYNLEWQVVSVTPLDYAQINYINDKINNAQANAADPTILTLNKNYFSPQWTYNVSFTATSKLTNLYQVISYSIYYPGCPRATFSYDAQGGSVGIYYANQANDVIGAKVALKCFTQQPGLSITSISWATNAPNNQITITPSSDSLSVTLNKQVQQLRLDLVFALTLTINFRPSTRTNVNYQITATQQIFATQAYAEGSFQTFNNRLSTANEFDISAGMSKIISTSQRLSHIQWSISCPSDIFQSSNDYSSNCIIYWDGSFKFTTSSMQQMSIMTNYYYTLSLTTWAQFSDGNSMTKQYPYKWINLSTDLKNCPSVQIPSTINMASMLSNYQVTPIVQLDCGDSIYSILTSYDIINITWTIDSQKSQAISTSYNGLIAYLQYQKLQTSTSMSILGLSMVIVNIANQTDIKTIQKASIIYRGSSEIVIVLSNMNASDSGGLAVALNDQLMLNVSESYYQDSTTTALAYNPYNISYQWLCQQPIQCNSQMSALLSINSTTLIEYSLSAFGYYQIFSVNATYLPNTIIQAQRYFVIKTTLPSNQYDISSCYPMTISSNNGTLNATLNGAYQFVYSDTNVTDLYLTPPILSANVCSMNLIDVGQYIQLDYPLSANFLQLYKFKSSNDSFFLSSKYLLNQTTNQVIEFYHIMKDINNNYYYSSQQLQLIYLMPDMNIQLRATTHIYYVKQDQDINITVDVFNLASFDALYFNWSCLASQVCFRNQNLSIIIDQSSRVQSGMNQIGQYYSLSVQGYSQYYSKYTNTVPMKLFILPPDQLDSTQNYCFITNYTNLPSRMLSLSDQTVDNIPVRLQFIQLCQNLERGNIDWIVNYQQNVKYYGMETFQGGQYLGLNYTTGLYNFGSQNYLLLESLLEYTDENGNFGEKDDQLAIYLQTQTLTFEILGQNTIELAAYQLTLQNSLFFAYNDSGQEFSFDLSTSYYCQWNCPSVFGSSNCSNNCKILQLYLLESNYQPFNSTITQLMLQPQLFNLKIYADPLFQTLLGSRFTYINIVNDTTYPFCEIIQLGGLNQSFGLQLSQQIQFRVYCEGSISNYSQFSYQWNIQGLNTTNSDYIVSQSQRYIMIRPYTLINLPNNYLTCQINKTTASTQLQTSYTYRQYLKFKTSNNITDPGDIIIITGLINGITNYGYATLFNLQIPQSIVSFSGLPFLYYQVKYINLFSTDINYLVEKTIEKNIVFTIPSFYISQIWLEITDAYDNIVIRNLTNKIQLTTLTYSGDYKLAIDQLFQFMDTNLTDTTEQIIQIIDLTANIFETMQLINLPAAVQISYVTQMIFNFAELGCLSNLELIVISKEGKNIVAQKSMIFLNLILERYATIISEAQIQQTLKCLTDIIGRESIFTFGYNVTSFSYSIIALVNQIQNSESSLQAQQINQLNLLQSLAASYYGTNIFPSLTQLQLQNNIVVLTTDIIDLKIKGVQNVYLSSPYLNSPTENGIDLNQTIQIPIQDPAFTAYDQVSFSVVYQKVNNPNIIAGYTTIISAMAINYPLDVQNLYSPITLTYSDIANYNQRDVVCAYYDDVQQKWYNNGIKTKIISNKQISCETLHLTSFAILTKEYYDWQLNDHIGYLQNFKSQLKLILGFSLTYFITFLFAICQSKQTCTNNGIRDKGKILDINEMTKTLSLGQQKQNISIQKPKCYQIYWIIFKHFNPILSFIFVYYKKYQRFIRHLVLWNLILVISGVFSGFYWYYTEIEPFIEKSTIYSQNYLILSIAAGIFILSGFVTEIALLLVLSSRRQLKSKIIREVKLTEDNAANLTFDGEGLPEERRELSEKDSQENDSQQLDTEQDHYPDIYTEEVNEHTHLSGKKQKRLNTMNIVDQDQTIDPDANLGQDNTSDIRFNQNNNQLNPDSDGEFDYKGSPQIKGLTPDTKYQNNKKMIIEERLRIKDVIKNQGKGKQFDFDQDDDIGQEQHQISLRSSIESQRTQYQEKHVDQMNHITPQEAFSSQKVQEDLQKVEYKSRLSKGQIHNEQIAIEKYNQQNQENGSQSQDQQEITHIERIIKPSKCAHTLLLFTLKRFTIFLLFLISMALIGVNCYFLRYLQTQYYWNWAYGTIACIIIIYFILDFFINFLTASLVYFIVQRNMAQKQNQITPTLLIIDNNHATSNQSIQDQDTIKEISIVTPNNDLNDTQHQNAPHHNSVYKQQQNKTLKPSIEEPQNSQIQSPSNNKVCCSKIMLWLIVWLFISKEKYKLMMQDLKRKCQVHLSILEI